MMGLMVVVASRSKSRQKVEELSEVEKPQRLEKSAKAIGLEEPSFLTSDTRLATMENCWLWKSLRTASCKHKVLVRSYLYQANGATDTLSHLFLKGARKIFEPRILESSAGCSPCWPTPTFRISTSSSSLTLPHQVFVYKTHVIPPLNSGDVLRKKTSYSRISLMAGRMLRELCMTKACFTFLRSSELSSLATLILRRLENSLPGKNTRPAVATNTYPSLKTYQTGLSKASSKDSPLLSALKSIDLQRWYIPNRRR